MFGCKIKMRRTGKPEVTMYQKEVDKVDKDKKINKVDKDKKIKWIKIRK